MSLTGTDKVVIPAEAIAYIEQCGGPNPLNFEVIEYFFEWLRAQKGSYVAEFLRQAISNE